MAVLKGYQSGRDFTAEELLNRKIRIEGPVKNLAGYAMMIIADDEMVGNAVKLELTIEPNQVVEATVTLSVSTGLHSYQNEKVTLRDDINVSFSAIATKVV